MVNLNSMFNATHPATTVLAQWLRKAVGTCPPMKRVKGPEYVLSPLQY